jgi:hypothetical protein
MRLRDLRLIPAMDQEKKFVVHQVDLTELQRTCCFSEVLAYAATAAESREFLIHVADTCEQCVRPGLKGLCGSAESAFREMRDMGRACTGREFWSLGVPRLEAGTPLPLQEQAYFETALVTYLGLEEDVTAAAVVRLNKSTHPDHITVWLQSQLKLCSQCAMHRITLSSLEARHLTATTEEVSRDAVAATWAQYQAYLLKLAAAFNESKAPRISELIKVLEANRKNVILKPLYKPSSGKSTLLGFDSDSMIENLQLIFGFKVPGKMPPSAAEQFRASFAFDETDDEKQIYSLLCEKAAEGLGSY